MEFTARCVWGEGRYQTRADAVRRVWSVAFQQSWIEKAQILVQAMRLSIMRNGHVVRDWEGARKAVDTIDGRDAQSNEHRGVVVNDTHDEMGRVLGCGGSISMYCPM